MLAIRLRALRGFMLSDMLPGVVLLMTYHQHLWHQNLLTCIVCALQVVMLLSEVIM